MCPMCLCVPKKMTYLLSKKKPNALLIGLFDKLKINLFHVIISNMVTKIFYCFFTALKHSIKAKVAF
jgi:hypothetical protein